MRGCARARPNERWHARRAAGKHALNEGYERVADLAGELPATWLVCAGDRQDGLLALLTNHVRQTFIEAVEPVNRYRTR